MLRLNPDLEIINNRLQLLYKALQYDTYNTKKFSVMERIQINQERGALVDMLNYLKGELDADTGVRTLRVSARLDKKIVQVNSIIESNRAKIINKQNSNN